jgi:hypothetical protein
MNASTRSRLLCIGAATAKPSAWEDMGMLPPPIRHWDLVIGHLELTLLCAAALNNQRVDQLQAGRAKKAPGIRRVPGGRRTPWCIRERLDGGAAASCRARAGLSSSCAGVHEAVAGLLADRVAARSAEKHQSALQVQTRPPTNFAIFARTVGSMVHGTWTSVAASLSQQRGATFPASMRRENRPSTSEGQE